MPYSRPQPTIFVGDITATCNRPFLKIRKLPVRVRKLNYMVTEDFTAHPVNDWFIKVVEIDGTGTVVWSGDTVKLETDSVKAYTWNLIQDDIGWKSDTTLAVRFVEQGTAGDLVGVSISFEVEERYDEQ